MALRILAFFSIICIIALFPSRFPCIAAARHLQAETMYLRVATLQSALSKSPTPLPGNPCTGIPSKSSGICKLSEKNFAGSQRVAHPPPPAHPMAHGTIGFGVASVASETDQGAAHQRS